MLLVLEPNFRVHLGLPVDLRKVVDASIIDLFFKKILPSRYIVKDTGVEITDVLNFPCIPIIVCYTFLLGYDLNNGDKNLHNGSYS